MREADGSRLAGQGVQPLVVMFIAAVVGAVTDWRWGLSTVTWLVACTIALAMWWVARRRHRDLRASILLLLAVACTMGAWHHSYWRFYRGDELGLAASETPRPICLIGIARSAPRVRPAPLPDPMRNIEEEDRSLFTVRVVKVRNGREWQPASGKVHVLIDGEVTSVHAGDRVRIVGKFSRPSTPLNPGEFDFAATARRDRRLCRVNAEAPSCVELISRSSWWNPRYLLARLRDRSDAVLWDSVEHERAGIATAVLLGIREQVDRERFDDYLATGTVHLLSISGLHVGILAYGFWLAMRLGWLSRRRTLLIAMVLVVVYATLTDARPPVVRAAVLICVMCVARILGRRAFEFNTLAVAGLFVLLLNPTSVFHVGPQLSFLAVATLAASTRLRLRLDEPLDPLDRLIEESRPLPVRLTRKLGGLIWQLWLTSTVIWVMALPLVMWRFHLLSPIAILLNPIVWFPMGLSLFAGFGVLVFSWVPPLAHMCARLCDLCLWSIEYCIQAALSVPGNHLWVPSPPLWWVVSFYAVMALFTAFPRIRPRRSWVTAMVVAWFALGFTLVLGPRWQSERDELICSFVSVGHGTSVLVELPDGRTILYDAGRLGSPVAAVRPISAVLWDRQITHIDAVVISHADIDHFNALPRLFERFSVGVVYVSPVMFREETPALRALQDAIAEHRIPLCRLSTDDRLATGPDATIDVLHPTRQGVDADDNANSIVLSIDYAGKRLLLPGDLANVGLEDLLAEMPIDFDGLMAPHHGSAKSHPHAVAAWSTPESVIISSGRGRSTSVTTTAYGASGARVWHTARHGMVRVTLRRDGVHVHSFRETQTEHEAQP